MSLWAMIGIAIALTILIGVARELMRMRGNRDARVAGQVILICCGIILILLLAGCGPVSRNNPNSPVLPPNLVVIAFEARATSGLVHVSIDAIDVDGRATSRIGPGYPMEVIRSSPYEHTHYYEPGLIILFTMDVFASGDVGDVVGCEIIDNGHSVGGQGVSVASVQPGRTQAGVHCTYTTKAVPPA